MKLKLIDFGTKILLCLLAVFCLSTCGIEEFYYLPQVPEKNIEVTFNDSATVNIPSIDTTEHYYATGYRIYYRIYLSSVPGGTLDTNISSAYDTDFNAFASLRDPTNTSSIPTITTFSGRGYYELYKDVNEVFQINPSGGTLIILFPTDPSYPYFTLNSGAQENLFRDKEFVPSEPNHEPYFRNTSGLNESSNSTTRKNMDVASGQSNHAYVAMYIVAIGQNPTSFQIIYGKPTMISVFKLPNLN